MEMLPFEDKPHFEIIDGEKVNVPWPPARHAVLASFVVGLLPCFRDNGIGAACIETLFDLQIGRSRRPNIAVVRYDRWPRSRRVPPGDAWNVVPNLAIEIRGSPQPCDYLHQKLVDYFRAGVSLVWVIHPQHGQIYVYTSIKDVRVLDLSDTLDGGNVIPGFQLPLATLFESNAGTPV